MVGDEKKGKGDKCAKFQKTIVKDKNQE